MEKKQSILIVDDNPNNLQLLGTTLRKEEYSLMVANSGQRALDIVKSKKPDLILLDIMMPEMDGYEVCEKLKADEDTKDIPVIFLTAKNEIEDIVKGFDVGGIDYVSKPFNYKVLKARINTQLKIKAYADKITEQKDELEELNNTKDTFFSIIAHDLKSPLSSFRNIVDLISTNYEDFTDDEIKEIIESLKDSSALVYQLLENLLTWSRQQRGKIDFEPQNFPINALFKNIISVNEASADKKKIATKIEIPDELSVYADLNMVSLVIRNLISNSIKFTPEGKSITAKFVSSDDSYLTFCVEDEGVGIKPEDVEKIFALDKQHTTLGTNQERGTGLGLAMCLDFIHIHKAKIWVESEIGKGSKFFFTLPSSQEAFESNQSE